VDKRRVLSPEKRAMQRLQDASDALSRRIDDIESLARDNRRILEVQFKRIAAIQAELDVLLAERRRAG
jgi:uncharacterized protein YigA (DUF484 family)